MQETFYRKIVERYAQWCAATSHEDSIDEALSSLDLDTNPSKHAPAFNNNARSKRGSQKANELSIIILAMRKIREAIVASSRSDEFALRAYTFIIRAAIKAKHLESYHPALGYLLQKLHPCLPLTPSEKQEFVGYYIIDLACRQGDLAAAYEARNKYQCKDPKVAILLHALVHDNWHLFWETQKSVSSYQRLLMESAHGKMRMKALSCLGRSYLSAEKNYVEKVAGRSWEKLKEQDNVRWELDGEMVIIRGIKRT